MINLPIIGRKARVERARLQRLIKSLRTPKTAETYVDGAGEICAPSLHAPVYSFAHPNARPAVVGPLFTAADTAMARRILEAS